MRNCLLLTVIAWFCVCGIATAHNLPPCYDPETGYLREVGGDELKAHGGHDLPPIRYAFGTRDTYGFHFSYVIDENGHVSCIVTQKRYATDGTPMETTPQRQAFLDAVAAQTFTPFVEDGQPLKVRVEGLAHEEEEPQSHVARPQGDAASALISLELSGHRSGDGPFKVTIKGDGSVTYTPDQGDDGWWLGTQTYHIPPAEVAAMLDLAENADFWSLRDVYKALNPPGPPGKNMDAVGQTYYSRVEITLGGHSKSLTIYDWGDPKGVSETARALMHAMADRARIRLWQNTTADTVAQLALNGFDFKSEKGAELLIRIARNSRAPDSVVEDLVARGAPQDLVLRGYYVLHTSLLDAVIGGGRVAMANRMIDQGALLKDGKPDPERVSRAFVHAVEAASPALVVRLMPYRPALSVNEDGTPCPPKNRETCDSVITHLGQARWDEDTPDLVTVARQLLEAGADINARDTQGASLLQNAIREHHTALVAWLLGKGATVTDDDVEISIGYAEGDDMTLVLLDGGAGISADNLQRLVEKAHGYGHGKLKAWLEMHGKWPKA